MKLSEMSKDELEMHLDHALQDQAYYEYKAKEYQALIESIEQEIREIDKV